MIKQSIVIILLGIVIAISVNMVSPNAIPFVGVWPTVSGSDSVVVPPSAEEGDPLFVSLDEAATKYQSKKILFIDARDPEDYEYAHITGSYNMAYDYIEEDYWENTPEILYEYEGFVIYCSGTECELSLYLGRDMIYRGFRNVFVFYGGWSEWERAGLPVTDKNEGEQ